MNQTQTTISAILNNSMTGVLSNNCGDDNDNLNNSGYILN